MGDGPRDWNPPGYWDSPGTATSWRSVTRGPTATAHRRGRWGALGAIMLGAFACWWPLSQPAPASGFHGYAFTTVGITALFVAIRAYQRSTADRSSRVLPVIGIVLGVLGTVFCLWSVAAFHFPQTVPALPAFGPATVSQQPLNEAEAARVVAPIPGAVITAPANQLRANLRQVTEALSSELSYVPGAKWVPASVTIQPDGLVTSANGTYLLPSYLRMTFIPAGDRVNFRLVITDSPSGMSETYDSRIVGRLES